MNLIERLTQELENKRREITKQLEKIERLQIEINDLEDVLQRVDKSHQVSEQ